MIKWSEENDTDVNHSIALLTGEEPEKWYPYGGIKGKDYCNNPSDAWPIICANKISINLKSYRAILFGLQKFKALMASGRRKVNVHCGQPWSVSC